MIRSFKITALFIAITCFFCFPAIAKAQVLTQVTVIHASTDSNQIDAGLSSMIDELQSIFRYTSYTLVTTQSLNLEFNQKGQVTLPEARTLTVIPLQMNDQRISYQIDIEKNNKSVFQTKLGLNNNSSVTIGGPQYKNGVLLFNIKGTVQ